MITKCLLLFVYFITFTHSSYGYIDPGTGSYIIQLLIAAIATSLYAIKYFWSNIKAFFAKFKKKKAPLPPRSNTPMQAKGPKQ